MFLSRQQSTQDNKFRIVVGRIDERRNGKGIKSNSAPRT